MSQDRGFGIPRWLTAVNLLAIVVAMAIVVPMQVRASHSAAPTDLKVIVRFTATAFKLIWNDPAPGLTQAYIIQRSQASDFTSGVVEIRVAKSTFDFIDETLSPGKTFHYRVASLTGTDRSAYSNTARAVNPTGTNPAKPAAPNNISIAQVSGGLRVTWNNPASNETALWVQRSGDNGTNWDFRASLSLNSTSYVDNDAPAASPMYRIWTFNGGGLSPSPAVQYVNAQAPNTVPTPAVPSVPSNLASIPNINSIVPSNLTSNVGVPTVPTVPSNLASIPNVNSIVPSVNTASIVQSLQSTVPTVPAVPDVSKLHYWVGIRDDAGTYLVNFWLYPSDCAGLNRCAPPDDSLFLCQDVPFLTAYNYCTYFDSDISS